MRCKISKTLPWTEFLSQYQSSAESVGTYDRLTVWLYVHHTLIILITNDNALRMLEHVQNSTI